MRDKIKINDLHTKLIGIFSVVIFFLAWQYSATSGLVDPLFVGTPSKIFKESLSLLRQKEIISSTLASLRSFIISFSLAIILGVLFGLLVATNKNLYAISKPYIFAIDSIPKIVLIPLFIIWLGIGTQAIISFIFLTAVIPILINTIDGARAVDPKLIKMARSFKAHKPFILKSIIFFSALPYIFSGIRIARGRAITGLIIAEFLGLGKGMGYYISFYGATFETNKLMVLIALLLVINFSVLKLINLLELSIVKK